MKKKRRKKEKEKVGGMIIIADVHFLIDEFCKEEEMEEMLLWCDVL